MKRGQIRYCACGCGLPAKRCYSGDQFKSWRAFASGHSPCEKVEIQTSVALADCAYAAGVIDGEGCIYACIKKTKQGTISTYLQLSVAMCSENVVAWLAATFGGDVLVSQPPSLQKRVRFVWQVRGRNVGRVLQFLEGFLIEKKQRAKLAIELSGLLGSHPPARGKPVPEDQMERRRVIANAIKEFNQDPRSEDVLH